MTFFFTAGHYWAAWLTIGALIVHISAKSSITRLALSDRAPAAVIPAGGAGARPPGQAGANEGAEATVESLQQGGIYRTSPLNRAQAHDRDTLLALDLDGEPLALDHGFPLRLIAPNRPGVQQTKWVNKVVVS